MKQTDTLTFIKNLFYVLGKTESLKLLQDSNLTEREAKLLEMRFIKGQSLKEVAYELTIEEDSVNKCQSKVCKKLYTWIKNRNTIEQIVVLLQCQDYTPLQKVMVTC